MKLLINPLNEKAKEKYLNHGHFHDGDAGLDLYVLEDMNFKSGETNVIKFGISCQPEDGKAYYGSKTRAKSETELCSSITTKEGSRKENNFVIDKTESKIICINKPKYENDFII